MSRILAFGDVHGCSNHLDALLVAVNPTPRDCLIFLGDLVDRGPDTRGVVDRVRNLKDQFDVICLRGNHELMMQRSRHDTAERKMWMSVGGSETLASYSPIRGRMADVSAVPDSHWDFVERVCVDYHETDSTIFVHANLDPELPLSEQYELMLFWEFLTGPIRHTSGKTVVCGHTSQRSGAIWDLGDTICIDTAAYRGGKLTCLDVASWHYWQADARGRIGEGDLPERNEPEA
ncbi:MAG TPA: metallophosphoesterase family protein [Fimbriiglobus sp.]|jgi:serine/threonine protein phosphatase 1